MLGPGRVRHVARNSVDVLADRVASAKSPGPPHASIERDRCAHVKTLASTQISEGSKADIAIYERFLGKGPDLRTSLRLTENGNTALLKRSAHMFIARLMNGALTDWLTRASGDGYGGLSAILYSVWS
jgi:hypothetical protein